MVRRRRLGFRRRCRGCWSSCNVETLTMKRLTDRNEWSTVKSHREVSNRRLTLQADSYSSPNSNRLTIAFEEV